ncbi:MAG TPA: amphi-Trp domain-containing protein [Candidatus Sulfomarinibacteraceae bacterium]|nr:amphi-Trp domain-containing protein [Candidatus Sulfomarinibacteraceae bacterium]
MAKEIVLFKSEEQMSLENVISFLHELADKLATNEVTLQKGSESLTLQVPNRLVLEVKAEEEAKGERTQRSLEVELEWYEGEDEGPLSLG